MELRNKRILITAGPTWVAIDNVRVISNIATGKTGILLAEKLNELGAKVTLVLGPVEACCLDEKIRLIPFKFFEELKEIIKKELKFKKYDIVIHSAAVSDYRPQVEYKQKVKSNKKLWKLGLLPTIKIIDLLKKLNPSLFLVGFKFEPEADVEKNRLIEEAKNLLRRSRLDLVVANTVNKRRYQAYIINQNKVYPPVFNKKFLADKLIAVIGEEYGRA